MNRMICPGLLGLTSLRRPSGVPRTRRGTSGAGDQPDVGATMRSCLQALRHVAVDDAQAMPSAMAVLPTPGSPMSTGCSGARPGPGCSARISSSRPMTGSSLPCWALRVRSTPHFEGLETGLGVGSLTLETPLLGADSRRPPRLAAVDTGDGREMSLTEPGGPAGIGPPARAGVRWRRTSHRVCRPGRPWSGRPCRARPRRPRLRPRRRTTVGRREFARGHLGRIGRRLAAAGGLEDRPRRRRLVAQGARRAGAAVRPGVRACRGVLLGPGQCFLGGRRESVHAYPPPDDSGGSAQLGRDSVRPGATPAMKSQRGETPPERCRCGRPSAPRVTPDISRFRRPCRKTGSESQAVA